MKIENLNARPDRPARQLRISLFKQLPAAEARRARRLAYEAALAVIG